MNSSLNLDYTVTFDKNGEKKVKESIAIPSEIDSTYDSSVRFLTAANNQNNNRKDDPNFGKWMIFIPSDKVDEIWKKVKQAVFEDKLRDAKVSTNNNVGTDHVLCVYAYNSNDFAEVKKIYETLVELGIVERDKKILFKLDVQTLNNQYGSAAYKYTSDQINMVNTMVAKLAQYSQARAEETGFVAGCRNLVRLNGTVKINACNNLKNYINSNGTVIKFSDVDIEALCEENSNLNNLVKECKTNGLELPQAIIDYDSRKTENKRAFYLYSKQI